MQDGLLFAYPLTPDGSGYLNWELYEAIILGIFDLAPNLLYDILGYYPSVSGNNLSDTLPPRCHPLIFLGGN